MGGVCTNLGAVYTSETPNKDPGREGTSPLLSIRDWTKQAFTDSDSLVSMWFTDLMLFTCLFNTRLQQEYPLLVNYLSILLSED